MLCLTLFTLIKNASSNKAVLLLFPTGLKVPLLFSVSHLFYFFMLKQVKWHSYHEELMWGELTHIGKQIVALGCINEHILHTDITNKLKASF